MKNLYKHKQMQT